MKTRKRFATHKRIAIWSYNPAERRLFLARQFIRRVLRLALGTVLFSLGISLTIQANVGLPPWESFHSGLSIVTGLSFGTVSIIAGLVIITIDLLLKERLGIGTFINIIPVGIFLDLIQTMQIIPLCQDFALGIVMLISGLFIFGVGTFFYVSSGFGAGPRDSMMVAIARRLPRIPIGVIRSVVEGTVLALGWLMGAKIGLGTVIYVVGVGSAIQFVFKLFKFDPKTVKHETPLATCRIIRDILKKTNTTA